MNQRHLLMVVISLVISLLTSVALMVVGQPFAATAKRRSASNIKLSRCCPTRRTCKPG
jgi:hypothetical protein